MRRAFTLIEMLMVMAILAMLASLLFPVFAQARRSAKGARCLGNLHQIGLATDLYTNDSDGFYPLAVDSADRFLMGWEPEPESAAETYRLLSTAPVLRDVMRPYVGSDGIWHCPADEFSQEQRAHFADRTSRMFEIQPNAFAKLGTSYAYRVGLGFDHVTAPAGCVYHSIVDIDFGPTESILYWDFTFKSHEINEHPNIAFDPATLQQNALFADGHARHINGDQFTRGTFCDGR